MVSITRLNDWKSIRIYRKDNFNNPRIFINSFIIYSAYNNYRNVHIFYSLVSFIWCLFTIQPIFTRFFSFFLYFGLFLFKFKKNFVPFSTFCWNFLYPKGVTHKTNVKLSYKNYRNVLFYWIFIDFKTHPTIFLSFFCYKIIKSTL